MRRFLILLIPLMFLQVSCTDNNSYTDKNVPIPNIGNESKPARLLIVPDNFPTIENAYANAKDGEIITIKPGKYELSKILVINRNVTFRGDTDNPEAVVIDCSTSYTFQITGGSPSFQNLTINNHSSSEDDGCCFSIMGGTPKLQRCIITSRNDSGISISGIEANPLVEKCVLKNCVGGVLVRDNGKGEFRDCDIYGNEIGIMVSESGNPTFIGCTIHDMKGREGVVGLLKIIYGCGVLVAMEGRGVFRDCEIYGNALAGIKVMKSGNPTVTGCKIHDGKETGVSILDQGRGVFKDCEIFRNDHVGINVESGGYPSFTECSIYDGKKSGIWIHNKGCGTFNNNKLWNNGTGTFFAKDWYIESDAGIVTGSENSPMLPSQR